MAMSKSEFAKRLFIVFCFVTAFFISLPFIGSRYIYNLQDLVILIPGAMSIALVITLLHGGCAYCRRESRDGWIIEDSSSETDISAP